MKLFGRFALLLVLYILGTATPAPAAPAVRLDLPLVIAPPQPPSLSWLGYLNQLRALGALPAVSERADLSNGTYLHARYMVKNDVVAHSEDSSLPFYSTAGAAAAARSNV